VSRVGRALLVAALVLGGGGAVVTEALHASGGTGPVPERSPGPARDGDVRPAVCDRRPDPAPSTIPPSRDPDPSRATVVLCPES
jgi:hypothetical protein